MKFDLKEYGHVGVFGGTGSGKTTYIKRILRELESSADDVYVYTTTGFQWQDVSNNIFDDFGNIGSIVSRINKTKNEKKGIIIFDDFNEVIQTQTNQQYIALFTTGRHAGIIIINGAHTPTSMGAKARKNLKYSVIMNTNDVETINSLSKFYLLGDSDKLITALDNKPSKYDAIVIENETRKINYDNANSVDNPGVGNSSGNPGSNGSGSNGCMDFKKSYNDCNIMDDSNTKYNINQNIEIKNMIEANTLKNTLSIVNYKHKIEIKKLEKQEELKNLILKFGKSKDDKIRIASLLNIFITNYTVTISDYEEYIEPFMNNYFPEYNYNKEKCKYTEILDNNIMDIYNEDYKGIVVSNALKYGGTFLNSFFKM